MDYKTTLIMPKTDFEMKANLAKKEPIFQKQWLDIKLEKKIYEQNKNLKTYILHDGPPYANGFLHVGHALNKIIKDIIVRYKNMSGFLSIFIAGWDTHGMPIEVALDKKTKDKKANLTIAEKRNNCLQFALEWIEIQKNQFTRIGILSSMENIYRTLDLKFEIEQLKIFNKMLDDNLIFQDLKPIYWSWSSQTALAEAEVEYQDVESDSIYVGFDVVQSNILEKNDKLLIWTTTPWTIPSNLAVAVKANSIYAKVKTPKSNIIVLKSKVDDIMKELSISDFKVVQEFKGKEFERTKYKHPLYDKFGIVINDDYVSETDGTGLVHNAPGFGNDDYLACKKYDIHPFCPINELGHFTSEVNDHEIEDLFYLKANPSIIERLIKTNNLLQHKRITHSAAHDWRTKKPLIYRATKQWFVNISKINKNINKELDKVQSPQGSEIIERMREMINNRPEWCISRQRYWGVPIIIIYDENKKPIIDKELQNNILKILEKEGTNAWFEKDVKQFLTSKYDLSKKYYKEKDIMDVWFDSGTTHNILKLNNLPYPADLYFEGKDQFRGWFNSSLITGVAYNNQAPYKTLITHGFTLDKDGLKMSKSKGNIVDPMKVCDEYGADVLRIWAANTEYSNDVRIFPELLKQIAEIYRRIRNTIFKFILGNLNDFNENFKPNYSEIDLYVLNRMNQVANEAQKYYDNFDFKNVVRNMNEFAIELSSWYFDYVKDSLYCDNLSNQKRQSIQHVLFNILKTYLIVLAPIIPHTCEEAYQSLNIKNKKASIHLEKFNFENKISNKKDENWKHFFKLKTEIYSALENARTNKLINKNNEAKVILKSTTIPFDEEKMKSYLNIAEFVFKKQTDQEIEIFKTNFNKCQRCWNHYDKKQMKNDEICHRCSSVIEK